MKCPELQERGDCSGWEETEVYFRPSSMQLIDGMERRLGCASVPWKCIWGEAPEMLSLEEGVLAARFGLGRDRSRSGVTW